MIFPSLVELKENDYISIRLMYAAPDNITGADVYHRFGLGNRCFARPELAAALTRLEQPLKQRRLKLKIFDAYRPPAAHDYLRDHTPVKGLFAERAKLSMHCRGIAVDVCLTDENDKELQFPTAVDAYTPEYARQLAQGITEPYFKHLQKANYACTDLPLPAVQNRELLRTLMQNAGFEYLQHEWWHFCLPDKTRYGVIDFPEQTLPDNL